MFFLFPIFTDIIEGFINVFFIFIKLSEPESQNMKGSF